MPGIQIHGDDDIMKGSLMFFDKAVGAYLDDNQTRPDVKFGLLRDMRQAGNLYLTDVRPANPGAGIHHHEADLVGFKPNGDAICFKLRLDQNMTMTGFAKKNLSDMSAPTREMAEDIRQHLGFEARSPALK